MKKFFVRRVMPVFMAVVMSFSVCVVPSKAVALETITSIIELIGAANDIKQFAEDVFSFFNGTDPEDWGTWWCATQYVPTRDHAFYTQQTLSDLCCDWNQNYKQQYHSMEAVVTELGFKNYKYVVLRPKNGIVNENFRQVVLTHPDGTVIAYDPALDEDPAEPEVPGADSYGRWITEEIFEKSEKMRMLSMEELTNLANDVGADLAWNDTYYYIYRDDGCLVYADASGRPYAAFRDPDKFASQTERPGTSVETEEEEDSELPEDFDSKIDLENLLITLPDGTLAVLDSVIYDESTKSYYIDSHDTYNTENNYYYHWEYHINYTSITYIGQTEEYNKYYEVYYELPDGRDSADLTKEDLEQLNLSVDVIPYGRSADDTSLRSLYHFDGDTRDSSYWNYCTDFTWNKGASLTYMDAAVFDGALYLDEQEHAFTLTLPSNITSGGFTLQFRYYQSHTEAPQTDSYINFGGTTVMQFDGGTFKNADGTALASTPVGTWNEVALIFDNGIMYYYLNGVCIGSQGGLVPSGNTIKFHFGSAQQTYKYFDELRVLNYALKTGGAYYEPTSVPHDTNLSLVLPGSAVPVADEYWSFTSSGENLLNTDFTTGSIPDSIASGTNKTSSTWWASFPNWSYNSDSTSLVSYSNFLRIVNLDTDTGYTSDGSYRRWHGGLFVALQKSTSGTLESGDYVFSIVLADGTVLSCPIEWPPAGDSTYVDYTRQQYDWGEFGVVKIKNFSSGKHCFLYIMPKVGQYVDIAYTELIAGTSTDLKAEWVTTVTEMTEDQFKTPTLAVRTDLDITSYQIGGVRPSIPEKGQVWAMVENERITSIQIYNGQAWEGVDGRIWTGSRWIPASSYNIITLQDMYDIVDATPNYEYIYSEAGFWAWWQKSWNAFTEKLFAVLSSGGAGGSGASGGAGSSEMSNVDLDAEDPVSDPAEEDSKSLWQFIVLVVSGGKSVISGTRELFSGAVSSVPESMGDIVSTFDSGGLAVGLLDGSYLDPDLADLPQDDSGEAAAQIEEVDPWRYR